MRTIIKLLAVIAALAAPAAALAIDVPPPTPWAFDYPQQEVQRVGNEWQVRTVTTEGVDQTKTWGELKTRYTNRVGIGPETIRFRNHEAVSASVIKMDDGRVYYECSIDWIDGWGVAFNGGINLPEDQQLSPCGEALYNESPNIPEAHPWEGGQPYPETIEYVEWNAAYYAADQLVEIAPGWWVPLYPKWVMKLVLSDGSETFPNGGLVSRRPTGDGSLYFKGSEFVGGAVVQLHGYEGAWYNCKLTIAPTWGIVSYGIGGNPFPGERNLPECDINHPRVETGPGGVKPFLAGDRIEADWIALDDGRQWRGCWMIAPLNGEIQNGVRNALDGEIHAPCDMSNPFKITVYTGDGSARFKRGDSVFGAYIELDMPDGRKVENCRIDWVSVEGTLHGGVINLKPWAPDLLAMKACF